jgi:short-subunit dehydrogenase
MKRILVLGATSAIAMAIARRYAARGDAFVLAARDGPRTESVAQDLRVRGAPSAHAMIADLNDLGSLDRVVEQAKIAMGGIDIALLAYGVLGDPARAKEDPTTLEHLLHVNFVSAAAWCEKLVKVFEAQGHGTLAVIGSVAGDRGRQSNYAYGAAKGGLAIFLDGLRHRLAATPIRVVTLKPGFVDTPMTAAFPKGPLWASADKAAASIVAAIDAGKAVAYVPGFWRLIMLVVRSLPRALLHKTTL